MALRKYLTEFIGTFFLVLTIGFAITSKNTALAPLAIGAALMAMVYMGGHVSGAHYNPAVSLAVAIRGKMSPADFFPYVICQIAGAILAALTVHLVRGVQFEVHLANTTGVGHALVVEFLFTFALALVVVNVATAPKNAGNSFYGLAIGFIVTAGAWAVGDVSGAAFNPAVGTGPNLVEMATGGGAHVLKDLWIYWAAPMAGGLLAGLVCNFQCADQDSSTS